MEGLDQGASVLRFRVRLHVCPHRSKCDRHDDAALSYHCFRIRPKTRQGNSILNCPSTAMLVHMFTSLFALRVGPHNEKVCKQTHSSCNVDCCHGSWLSSLCIPEYWSGCFMAYLSSSSHPGCRNCDDAEHFYFAYFWRDKLRCRVCCICLRDLFFPRQVCQRISSFLARGKVQRRR